MTAEERAIFRIPGRLPGLNEYTDACRSNRHAGATMKRQMEWLIGVAIVNARMKPVTVPVTVNIRWCEKNKMRDLDNIAFAKKFILDALVRRGILAGDGWKHVAGLTDTFAVDAADPHILVVLTAVKP